MNIEMTFLGTSSMVPTKERNVQGIYLEYKGEGILIDCGEGSQRQMNIAGINRLKVKKVFISHWHGDHVAGLIGLIQTIGNTDEPGTLTVFGPEGTKFHMNHLINSCVFDMRIDLKIKEFKPKSKETIFENEDYKVEAAPLNHSCPCIGYTFIEKSKRKMSMDKLKKLGIKEGPLVGKLQKGIAVKIKDKTVNPDEVSTMTEEKKIAFILDTTLTESCYDLAENADILVSEATFESSKKEKAIQFKHMTTDDVATIASRANVKKLILTHFSQRYKTLHDLEDEARSIFPNTVMAYDFMKVKL